MPENDPGELADQREREADRLEQRGEALEGDVENVRQDWERKRADQGVPGAPPREGDGAEAEDARSSPAPEAPPEGAGPSAAETPTEGAGGPPADTLDD